ncbi:tRNA (5-methylaminomethyl-2-thiouridylate) methyltransferase MnmA [Clostridium aceticum]|uniref:tRNA-specific 2-thiouridylase MnmA n=1 Tax=Clostridium aceticum TaxID=84022 RepID=A0A0D8ICT0_9CLOT|nr:tRNA 2-thiouridine(34) synthase MnmA [Clostridium aceticum]AKL95235.1 tRNA (5-methylaminomethyl-2-thiouridylate) methyltransferase MnmA [Clostridium aceticum]KJF28093.1 thiouridylase [Clostridium aceticum]
MQKNKKVLLGMSGGVDSSVAAYLLKKQGYEVIGVTMQIWQDDEEVNKSDVGCCSLSAVEDARRVAHKLDIPFYVMNFKDVFKEKVIQYFIDEYTKGRTPNPCIACNKYIKFEEFLRRALQLDCYYVATGHYAKIEYDEDTKKYLLKESATDEKDQTYALYNMTQEQLQHTLMPLGYYNKDEIRKIAEELELSVATKPDSQEICFVPDNDYGNFVEENSSKKVLEGDFVDQEGNVLGRHKGIIYYTIGQRKGLGIALGKPVYVTEIIPATNQVVLGDAEAVFGKELIANEVNFIPFETLEGPRRVKAKVRYNSKAAAATLYPCGEEVRVVFDEAQRAITPGQAVVFYEEDIVVGGGTIIKKI